MRSARYLMAALALLAAAACARTDAITSVQSPPAARHDIDPGDGTLSGSETNSTLPPLPGDTTGPGAVERGSGGFLGSGG